MAYFVLMCYGHSILSTSLTLPTSIPDSDEQASIAFHYNAICTKMHMTSRKFGGREHHHISVRRFITTAPVDPAFFWEQRVKEALCQSNFLHVN